ncbi:hypothetical protein Q8A73_023105 [Channa argus]|nr:hypothetical protein Q8A73_023105 [Channa argus]
MKQERNEGEVAFEGGPEVQAVAGGVELVVVGSEKLYIVVLEFHYNCFRSYLTVKAAPITSERYCISIGPLAKHRLLKISINISVANTVNRKLQHFGIKMINWKALDNVPVLLYILALKTLLLCLGFAGVKIYQSKKVEEAQKKEQAEKRRLAQQQEELINNLKED